MGTMRSTNQLREGDVVVNHGMRILLDGPAQVFGKDWGYTDENPVLVWPGKVLNAEQICDRLSKDYDPYIARHLRGIWWQDGGSRPERRDRWDIQGNHLAHWHIEPREDSR